MTDFAVLFVCTGNVCRSPMAERLLVARLGPAARVRAGSAGTHAVVGHPMDAASALVLRELGGDPLGHTATALLPAAIERAGLVLTATVEHRSAVLREAPRAMRRTFTMREFHRLGAAADLGATFDPAELVAAVADQRGLVDPSGPGADDIADPLAAPLPVVRQIGAQIEQAVSALIGILGLEQRL